MLVQRIMGILRLDVATYEEIEADESATTQAAMVVAIVAIIGGLVGGAISAAFDGSFIGTFLSTLISSFIGWIVWSVVTYFVGTSLFGGKSDIGQMLRVLGFAQAPGILAAIPVCGAIVGSIWTLVCTFIAIRQGLDLDNTKAALTAIVAWVAVFVVGLIIASIFAAIGLTVGVGMEALSG